MAAEPAITTYGERNPEAPAELDLFSFLVGKWSGTSPRLPDGNHAEWTWIGRYILNGMAIADEIHVSGLEGKPDLGITLRQFDTEHDAWVVEYLNVSNSFLRRQVNPNAGSVSREADSVVVISEDAQREFESATDWWIRTTSPTPWICPGMQVEPGTRCRSK